VSEVLDSQSNCRAPVAGVWNDVRMSRSATDAIQTERAVLGGVPLIEDFAELLEMPLEYSVELITTPGVTTARKLIHFPL
jgi:hypothetical protein